MIADKRLAGLEPARALDMGGEIAVAEPEPGFAAERLERGHEGPGLVAPPPAPLRIVESGERVHDGVEIGRNRQAQMLEVVAGIGHHHEIGARHDPAQPERKLGAADAAGQRDDEALAGVRDGVHRNKSSSGARISVAAGVGGPDQARPCTSTTGCASSDCPISGDAALAISSANPVWVTRRCVAEQIGPTAHVHERRQPRGAERDTDRAAPPRASPAVGDDDGEPLAEMRGEPIEQVGGRGIGIARQQQHRLRAQVGVDVGTIDAGIRHDEAEPMLDDQHAGPVANYPPRLSENDLDQPRVLVDFGGKRLRALRWLDVGEIDMAAFRLGDDLLRHHEYVAVRRRECAALARRDQQAGEIVAGPDQGDIGERCQRDDHRARSVGISKQFMRWQRSFNRICRTMDVNFGFATLVAGCRADNPSPMELHAAALLLTRSVHMLFSAIASVLGFEWRGVPLNGEWGLWPGFAHSLLRCLRCVPLALAPDAARAEKRIALVIGNASYQAGALETPANDAGLIAQTLQAAGFDVVGARDLDQDSLRRAFRDFLEKAISSGPDTVAFVYLSGHGLQLEGENYFVPIDARIARDADIAAEALRISDYTRPLAALRLKASIVVLDAARANQFATGGPPLAGGLALVDPEPGMLIAFNAAPGTVAPEEQGPYGPYAQALAEMMREGGLPLAGVFERTRLRVNETTRGGLVPWHASKVQTALVFFERAPDAPPPAVAPEQTAAIRARPMRELAAQEAYTVALERDTMQGYLDFIAAYPDDPMAKRVRAIVAARREAITWRRTRQVDTPPAYWSYLRRYPEGPHAADAHRRLAYLAAALEPPPSFAVMAYETCRRRRPRKSSTSGGRFWSSTIRSTHSRRRRLRRSSSLRRRRPNSWCWHRRRRR